MALQSEVRDFFQLKLPDIPGPPSSLPRESIGTTTKVLREMAMSEPTAVNVVPSAALSPSACRELSALLIISPDHEVAGTNRFLETHLDHLTDAHVTALASLPKDSSNSFLLPLVLSVAGQLSDKFNAPLSAEHLTRLGARFQLSENSHPVIEELRQDDRGGQVKVANFRRQEIKTLTKLLAKNGSNEFALWGIEDNAQGLDKMVSFLEQPRILNVRLITDILKSTLSSMAAEERTAIMQAARAVPISVVGTASLVSEGLKIPIEPRLFHAMSKVTLPADCAISGEHAASHDLPSASDVIEVVKGLNAPRTIDSVDAACFDLGQFPRTRVHGRNIASIFAAFEKDSLTMEDLWKFGALLEHPESFIDTRQIVNEGFYLSAMRRSLGRPLSPGLIKPIILPILESVNPFLMTQIACDFIERFGNGLTTARNQTRLLLGVLFTAQTMEWVDKTQREHMPGYLREVKHLPGGRELHKRKDFLDDLCETYPRINRIDFEFFGELTKQFVPSATTSLAHFRQGVLLFAKYYEPSRRDDETRPSPHQDFVDFKLPKIVEKHGPLSIGDLRTVLETASSNIVR